MTRTVHPPAAVIVAATLLFVACNGAPPPPAQPAEQAVAHDFTLQNLDGESKSLSDWAGQVLLIDFWATWCAPCREEIPWLKELQQNYEDDGFTLVAISDENAEIVRKFVEERGITYVNLVDPGEATQSYGVVSLPTAFLVDREGNIAEEFRGVKPQKILEARLRELLGLPAETE